ncbi:Gfo/Idh/MocA family oxidoreductase [Devosia rhodophyticola]|uniref:Gfo/Idh/MocA family oxidoreductase n=1 Tax=Devosia rhodophyticola TaxID=3026423 RepID=A0ABY7YZ90_9HYPH|nr:Gfo/Idh/MocA family oxidoreductase [Devosia rhodophyticola]WDR06204.1 Gfo/Idh/MocA family oxidoreductase [Devosia rhodophyticola]
MSKRVLMIGAGGIARRHLKGYLQTGRAELAIVEPDSDKRSAVAAEFNLAAAHPTLDEVPLAQFDLAVICAPAHVHVPLMRTCAQARLPFLVEKPLSVEREGVDEVVKLVDEQGLLARVGYVRRVGKEVQALRKQLLDGKIGALKLVYMNSSQEFPKYRPDYRETYYARPELGGGAILDAASHLFDLLIWIAGAPDQVMCMYDRLVLEGTQTEDTCLISIRFQSGVMANIVLNQFQKPNVATFEFIGTKGNLQLEQSRLHFADDDSGKWSETHDYMDGMVPTEAHQARFGLQAHAMLDALEGKPCELATLAEARQNLMIAHAAKQSWQQKRIIAVAP